MYINIYSYNQYIPPPSVTVGPHPPPLIAYMILYHLSYNNVIIISSHPTTPIDSLIIQKMIPILFQININTPQYIIHNMHNNSPLFTTTTTALFTTNLKFILYTIQHTILQTNLFQYSSVILPSHIISIT